MDLLTEDEGFEFKYKPFCLIHGFFDYDNIENLLIKSHN